jgi:membrane protein implicated in regulation of membrane protease activity
LKRRRWEVPERPLPKHPYRDTVVVYGAMAIVLVLVAWATGGELGRAAIVASAFFVLATAWSWSRWRRRLQQAHRSPGSR